MFLFLVDVFQKFISTCLKYYNLDPTHYFSAPGLSWDAMLKMTKVELEKISDSEKYLFTESGMRGGICQVLKRYSKANNEFCPDYDPKKPKVYIKYLDMNNLYVGAMSEYLPYGGFKWVKVNNRVVNRVLNKSDNILHGYFLEVDLDYPKELHDKHNDLPLAPEKIKVTEEMLAPLQLEIKNNFDIKTGDIKKLTPDLYSKKNYVVHYRNLKYYLSQGLILKKVYRILEFKQSPSMKPYIDFNTPKRMEAIYEADKNLFKLLNNAVYGKTMENMRKRMKIRIIKTPKDFLKYASRPAYVNHNIFGKNLVAIHEKPEELKLNKPIYVGRTVLELSRLAMYEFYYDFLKQKCESVRQLYMDTDSFIIEVIGENFDVIMLENKKIFHLSNFSKNSKYYCGEKKKVPGKMKDEYGGTSILEFAPPKPKSYTIIDENNCEITVHKGQTSNFKSSEFKDVVNDKKVFRHIMKKISSKKHEIYTQESDKISLSCFNDKRYILEDGINTLAFGHTDIPTRN